MQIMTQPKSSTQLDFSAPRLTRRAYGLLLTRAVLPFLAVLSVADALLYLLFRYGFGMCYGVWCWF
jgi:hypothetical protein